MTSFIITDLKTEESFIIDDPQRAKQYSNLNRLAGEQFLKVEEIPNE